MSGFQPVFVVGCPRSGTTLAGELVAASRQAFNGKESFFLYLMSNWKQMLRPPVAPLTEQLIERAGEMMRQLIMVETSRRGKSHYVDHTPWHALCLEDVWSLFPEARVVYLVRHPADVVMSLERSYAAGYSWAGATMEERIALWLRFHRAVKEHGSDPRMRLLPYEAMCTAPTEEGRSLFSWLDLPWSDDYLGVFAVAHASTPKQLSKAPSPGDVAGPAVSLRSRRPQSLVRELQVRAKAEMREYGYASEA